jgi:hypothetical protein
MKKIPNKEEFLSKLSTKTFRRREKTIKFNGEVNNLWELLQFTFSIEMKDIKKSVRIFGNNFIVDNIQLSPEGGIMTVFYRTETNNILGVACTQRGQLSGLFFYMNSYENNKKNDFGEVFLEFKNGFFILNKDMISKEEMEIILSSKKWNK